LKPVLQLSNVSVTFQDAMGKPFKALEIASLGFEPGHIVVISGASGSGKSTLLHVIAGLLPPAAGEVTWREKSISELTETRRDHWRRETIGYLFQDFQLIPEMTPLGNVALPGTFGRNRIPKNRAALLLTQFGVPQSRSSTAMLSRGEQQRVAFARALYFDPPVILADEPTASLDQANAEIVIEHLSKLASQGKTVITASHDAALIAKAKSHVRLDRGLLKAGAAK
jgi:putative ABC transport system ATP-binding protein